MEDVPTVPVIGLIKFLVMFLIPLIDPNFYLEVPNQYMTLIQGISLYISHHYILVVTAGLHCTTMTGHK